MSTDAGLAWFVGMGFRPAVETPPHRADEVDYPRIVPAPDSDVPFMAKWEALEPFLPSEGYAWGTWTPSAQAPADRITAAELSGPTPVPDVWHPSTPSQPWWPSEPNWPDYPCNCITPDSPDMPPLPEPAPVSLPASSACLLAGLVALAWLRRRA